MVVMKKCFYMWIDTDSLLVYTCYRMKGRVIGQHHGKACKRDNSDGMKMAIAMLFDSK